MATMKCMAMGRQAQGHTTGHDSRQDVRTHGHQAMEQQMTTKTRTRDVVMKKRAGTRNGDTEQEQHEVEDDGQAGRQAEKDDRWTAAGRHGHQAMEKMTKTTAGRQAGRQQTTCGAEEEAGRQQMQEDDGDTGQVGKAGTGRQAGRHGRGRTTARRPPPTGQEEEEEEEHSRRRGQQVTETTREEEAADGVAGSSSSRQRRQDR